MNKLPWSEREISRALALYQEGLACAEIARMVGRSETALRLKLLALGYSSRRVVLDNAPPAPVPSAVDLVDERFLSEPEEPYQERARRELEVGERRRADRERVNEAKQQLLEDRILDEFRRHLFDLPRHWLPVTPPPACSSVVKPLTAVLVISDVHCGQVVPPAELDGFGNY